MRGRTKAFSIEFYILIGPRRTIEDALGGEFNSLVSTYFRGGASNAPKGNLMDHSC